MRCILGIFVFMFVCGNANAQSKLEQEYGQNFIYYGIATSFNVKVDSNSYKIGTSYRLRGPKGIYIKGGGLSWSVWASGRRQQELSLFLYENDQLVDSMIVYPKVLKYAAVLVHNSLGDLRSGSYAVRELKGIRKILVRYTHPEYFGKVAKFDFDYIPVNENRNPVHEKGLHVRDQKLPAVVLELLSNAERGDVFHFREIKYYPVGDYPAPPPVEDIEILVK